MPANTSPIFTLTPNINFASLTGVDGSQDGTDADVKLVFTSGSNGSFLHKIRFQPISTSGSTTTSAAAARVYLNNGSTVGTAANNTLLVEFSLAAIIVNVAATAAAAGYEVPFNIQLPASYRIYVGVSAVAANTAWQVAAIGGDY